MFGVLNINKPPGWTSRDVVNRVQRLVRPQKCGHAGTLDPLATGVLLVAVGQATRLIEYAHRLRKEYRATFLLGRRSDTEDVESPIEELDSPPEPTRHEIEAAAARYVGDIQQRPSRHSAIKVDGRRAYDLARAGADFELAPRTVTVHRIGVVRYQYPELVLDVECGAGTYIRALGRDLAESLGTAAVMAALERTRVGALHVSRAVTVDELLAGIEPHLISPGLVVDFLPSITVSRDELRELCHGRSISRGWEPISPAVGSCGERHEIAAFDEHKNLVAILRERTLGHLSPVRNFAHVE